MSLYSSTILKSQYEMWILPLSLSKELSQWQLALLHCKVLIRCKVLRNSRSYTCMDMYIKPVSYNVTHTTLMLAFTTTKTPNGS